MSLAEKVGQLFIVGFEGTEVTPELEAWMATYGWGGVIIFGRNVESPAQVLLLTQGLQASGARLAAIRRCSSLSIRKGDGWHVSKHPSPPFRVRPGWARRAQSSLPATSVRPLRPSYVPSASPWTWHLSWMCSPIPPTR